MEEEVRSSEHELSWVFSKRWRTAETQTSENIQYCGCSGEDFTEGSFAQPCWSKIGTTFVSNMVGAIEKAQASETFWNCCATCSCSCNFGTGKEVNLHCQRQRMLDHLFKFLLGLQTSQWTLFKWFGFGSTALWISMVLFWVSDKEPHDQKTIAFGTCVVGGCWFVDHRHQRFSPEGPLQFCRRGWSYFMDPQGSVVTSCAVQLHEQEGYEWRERRVKAGSCSSCDNTNVKSRSVKLHQIWQQNQMVQDMQLTQK